MFSRVVFAGAALAVLAVPAAASTISYTITGTVIQGMDGADLFGGGQLAGDAFTAVEMFHTSNAASSYSSQWGSGANGGSNANGLSFIDVVLTINGKTTSFSDYTSNVSVSAGSQFNATVQSSATSNKNDIGFNIASPAIEADYTLQHTISGLSDPYAGYYTLTNSSGLEVDFANFEVNGLSVTSPSTINVVPLPSAAPMFGAALLALAAVGYGMRRLRFAADV